MQSINEDEAQLYDRQIRLWGIQTQNLLRHSRIILLGPPTAVSCEVSKNLVLAGVGGVDIISMPRLAEGSVETFLFGPEVTEEEIPQKMAESLSVLNPLVKISTHALGDLRECLKGASIVLATGATGPLYREWNTLAREAGVKFRCADAWGLGGWAFVDDGDEFAYSVGKGRDGSPVVSTQKYVPISEALQCSWKDANKRLLARAKKEAGMALLDVWTLWKFQESHSGQNPSSSDVDELRTISKSVCLDAGLEEDLLSDKQIKDIPISCRYTLAPAAAILGGIIAQDILNSISAKEETLANWFAFHSSLHHLAPGEVDAYGNKSGIWRLNLPAVQKASKA